MLRWMSYISEKNFCIYKCYSESLIQSEVVCLYSLKKLLIITNLIDLTLNLGSNHRLKKLITIKANTGNPKQVNLNQLNNVNN